METLVPIVAIVTSIGLPVVLVFIIVYLSHKKDLAKYELIEKVALQSESSPEIVEQMLRSISDENRKKTYPPRQRNLIQATILLALGISFFAFRFIVGNWEPTGMLIAAVVLTMLGIAKFIIAQFIIGKTPESSERS